MEDELNENIIREHPPLEDAYLKRAIAPDDIGTKAEHVKPAADLSPPAFAPHKKGGEMPEDEWMYT